jgi:hypothetical protein
MNDDLLPLTLTQVFIDVSCPLDIEGVQNSVRIIDPESNDSFDLLFKQTTSYEVLSARVVNANETIVAIRRLGRSSLDSEYLQIVVRGSSVQGRSADLCRQILIRHDAGCSISTRYVPS